MKVEDTIYWLKIALGVAYGYAAAMLSLRLGQQPAVIILLAILLYVLISEASYRVSSVSRRKSYLNGAGGFAGTFLVSWIVFFNLLI
jgi:hypothetical protein